MEKGLVIVLIVWGALAIDGKAQEIYTNTAGEMLFQMSEVNRGGNQIPTDLRWTIFFHLGQYFHFDFNDYVGLYSGIAIRNVGFIMNEKELNSQNESVLVKHIYRTYNIGIPLAFKVGSIKDNFFIFFGGEYEWLFHFKHKYWPSGGGSRNNEKVKYTDWFSSNTPYFIPSLFAGVQFPRGINVKFKYYMQNYLNKDYLDADGNKPYGDLNVRLFYISVSFTIPYRGTRTLWEKETITEYAYR